MWQFIAPGDPSDGIVAAWLMDGVNMVTSTPLNPNWPGDVHWRIVATADYNRDGYTDIIWQYQNPGGSGDGTPAVWFMNGINLSSAQLLNPSNSGIGWTVVAPK